jgi:hypothetical protein
MSAPIISREQACADARVALDAARARRDADYAAGRLTGDRLAAYELLLAAQAERGASRPLAA